MDATLTEKEFSKHVNTKFRAKVDADKEIPLELIEDKGYTSKHAEQQGMERFSILFVGPEDQPLLQMIYPFAHDEMGEFDYVDALISHTGVTFTADERDALVNGLTQNTMTRGGVLRSIAENDRFVSAKLNETFVMMEYFGYLRRQPDANGFAFWLDKLNQYGGNYEQAEMVKAFIVSGEYRDRFPR